MLRYHKMEHFSMSNLSKCLCIYIIILIEVVFLQLCFWNMDTWDKRKSIAIQLPAGRVPDGDTQVQFFSDQVRLLVYHETQLALYDASRMELIQQV